MDLDKFYNEKFISHWAEELQAGDRCVWYYLYISYNDAKTALKRLNQPQITCRNNFTKRTIFQKLY